MGVEDFNGDDRLDLAVANDTDPGTLSVLLGNGDGMPHAMSSDQCQESGLSLTPDA